MAERPPAGMPAFLRMWRRHRAIAAIPAHYRDRLPPSLLARQDSRPHGLTQLEMATMAGVRERHYAELERRGGPGFSREVIAAVAGILGLTQPQESALYRWGQHRPPPSLPGPSVDESLRRRLAEQMHIAMYIERDTWDVLAYNEMAAGHFPVLSEPGANIAEIILRPTPQTREMLMDWAASWARPVIEILRLAVATRPSNPRLQEVVASVRRNEEARRIWDADARMRDHTDGDIRPLRLPTLIGRDGVGKVELQSFIPERRPDLRLIVVAPTGPSATEVSGPARSVLSAQALADAVQRGLSAAVVCVNYRSPVPRASSDDQHIDVGLYRAAISTEPGRVLPDGYCRPGDRIPPFPRGSEPIAHHLRGGHILLNRRSDMEDAVAGRADLIRQLIPGPDIDSVAHAPLAIPDPDHPGETLVLGSMEVFGAQGASPFTSAHLDTMRHLVSLRAAALATAAA